MPEAQVQTLNLSQAHSADSSAAVPIGYHLFDKWQRDEVERSWVPVRTQQVEQSAGHESSESATRSFHDVLAAVSSNVGIQQLEHIAVH